MLVIPKLTCPVANASFSIVEMPDDLIAKMAVMVHDNLEWAIWLTGEKIENGRYRIDDYIIPDQKRGQSTVDIEEDVPDDSNVIGVIHSHHKMGVFFSGTDLTELNTIYPLSIVIATPDSSPRLGYAGHRTYLRDVKLFGFHYLGVASFDLPCGSVGEGGAFVVPYSKETGELYDGWDESNGLTDHSQITNQRTLTGCDKVEVSEIDENFRSYDKASCGLVSDWKEGEAIFGWDEEIKNEFDKLKALTQSAFVSSIPQSTGNSNQFASAWLFQTEPYRPQIRTMNVQSVELDTPAKWLYDLLATKLNRSNLRNCSIPKLVELLETTKEDETKLTMQFAKFFNIFKGNHKLLRDEEGLIVISLIGIFLETEFTVEDTVKWLDDPKLAMLFTSAVINAVNLP